MGGTTFNKEKDRRVESRFMLLFVDEAGQIYLDLNDFLAVRDNPRLDTTMDIHARL